MVSKLLFVACGISWYFLHTFAYLKIISTTVELSVIVRFVVPPWLEYSSAAGHTVYPKRYAHGFCFAVLCCGYTLTDFPISIKLTSLALWQSNDCPSASKATLMNMDRYFMYSSWIHYKWLHNHNKAKHNKTVCIFLGIYCSHVTHFCCWSISLFQRTSKPALHVISCKHQFVCHILRVR